MKTKEALIKEFNKIQKQYLEAVRLGNHKEIDRLALIWIIAIIVYGLFVLRPLGGNTPLVDAVTTVSSITAMILSVNGYKDQWKFWIICNATSVLMWTLACFRGDNSAFPMVVMWVAYLINSLVAKKEWDRM